MTTFEIIWDDDFVPLPKLRYRAGEVRLCPDCGCSYVVGLRRDTDAHRRWHSSMFQGVRWPRPPAEEPIAAARLPAGVGAYLVRPDAPTNVRRQVQRVASVANAETHYDFTPYHAGDPAPPLAYLAWSAGRVMGLVLLAYGSSWRAPFPWEPQEPIADNARCDRWVVRFAWVARDWRQQGVATGLVTAAATQQAVTPAELAWETPLSRLGRKLAHHFQPAGYFAA